MSQIKSRSKNPYLSLLQFSWQYARQQRKRFVLIYALFLMSNLIHSCLPLLWGWFINQVQLNGTAVLDIVWLYAGVYMMIHLLEWAAHGPARVMERELAFHLSHNFLQEMYHKTLHLPVKWHQDHHSGATINRVRKAYEALKKFFQGGFEYLHSIFKFTFSFAAMIYFAPMFGVIALLFGVIVVIVILKFDKPYIKTLHEVNEKEHVVSSTLFDSLSNIITVITLRLENRMQGSLYQKVMDIFPAFAKNVRINEWKWFVTDILVNGIYALILVGYVYSNYIPGEVFLIGGLVTVMAYVERFVSVFHNIAYQYTDIVKYHTDVTAILPILKAYDELEKPENALALPMNWESLSIQNLHFSHHAIVARNGKAIQGLKAVDIEIERGKKIALIGESGSGKSTLLALLRGLYQADEQVQLRLEGQQLVDFQQLPEQVTLFPQEPEIFENTIAYNISLGLDYTEKEMKQICEVAHFQEVVEQLPNGLESNIQEKGVNLSGGQKQRLALARGILAAKDSQLILLDEPTSSVDPKTESEIYDNLFAEFSDKAVVSTLHRLHLLNKFDYVYVMHNGQIVGKGTFEELKRSSPVFQDLWRHQEEMLVA